MDISRGAALLHGIYALLKRSAYPFGVLVLPDTAAAHACEGCMRAAARASEPAEPLYPASFCFKSNLVSDASTVWEPHPKAPAAVSAAHPPCPGRHVVKFRVMSGQ